MSDIQFNIKSVMKSNAEKDAIVQMQTEALANIFTVLYSLITTQEQHIKHLFYFIW